MRRRAPLSPVPAPAFALALALAPSLACGLRRGPLRLGGACLATIFDHNLLQGGWTLAFPVHSLHRLHHVHAVHDTTEDDVLSVQPGCLGRCLEGRAVADQGEAWDHAVAAEERTMKNCDPFVFGPELAIESRPTSVCLASKDSSARG